MNPYSTCRRRKLLLASLNAGKNSCLYVELNYSKNVLKNIDTPSILFLFFFLQGEDSLKRPHSVGIKYESINHALADGNVRMLMKSTSRNPAKANKMMSVML